jgi:hypothetical protein
MICERCQGKGIVPSQEQSVWRPEAWDGTERRQEPREAGPEASFREVAAPLFTTCEACQGLGRILPGLLSNKQ